MKNRFIQFISTELHTQIDEYITLKDGTGGAGSYVFKILLGGKSYAAKFTLTTENRICFIHNLLMHSTDPSMIAPIQISNKTYLAFENFYFELYPYIQHDEFNEFDLQPLTFVSMIQIVSRLHNFQPEGMNFLDHFSRSEELFAPKPETIKRLDEMIDCGIGLTLLNKCLGFYNQQIYLSLEPNFIHGDIHLNNFLYQDNKAVKIIDFDLCCIDSIYLDLASVLFFCCFFDKGSTIRKCDTHLFSFLLKKYQKSVLFQVDHTLLHIYIIATILKFEKDKQKQYEIIRSYCDCFEPSLRS